MIDNLAKQRSYLDSKSKRLFEPSTPCQRLFPKFSKLLAATLKVTDVSSVIKKRKSLNDALIWKYRKHQPFALINLWQATVFAIHHSPSGICFRPISANLIRLMTTSLSGRQ